MGKAVPILLLMSTDLGLSYHINTYRFLRYLFILVNLTQHDKIGKIVSPRACIGIGDHIGMALYYCPSCASNPFSGDLRPERIATAFSTPWAIGVKGCDYPDHSKTEQQYLGQLAPCRNISNSGS